MGGPSPGSCRLPRASGTGARRPWRGIPGSLDWGKTVGDKTISLAALGIVKALSGFHARGLVHRDVRPGNILVNAATGDAWLMGFGLTSRLPRQHQSLEAPEVIAGTLEYMAPEQTGRMNRSIDSRSDLYSLGVTLYEMLVGARPFTASDPMEWVHCHLARKPVAPSEQVSNIPEPVSAIVMKLLSKTAEDRYLIPRDPSRRTCEIAP